MSTESPLFENPQIAVEQLPSVEDLVFEPLHPSYRTVRIIGGSLLFLLICAMSVVYIVLSDKVSPIVFGITLLVNLGLLFNVCYLYFSFKYLGYALREKDITYQSGNWWKKTATTPFNRVQHCDVKQGLAERKFGLVKLTIYTASGGSTDLEIPGLTPIQAQHMKEFILKGRPIAEPEAEVEEAEND